MVDYRDPKNKKKTMNFAKPVVDIAASSRSQAGAKLASWGCSLTDKELRGVRCAKLSSAFSYTLPLVEVSKLNFELKLKLVTTSLVRGVRCAKLSSAFKYT